MITKPTVFVLGAGASQPYGFPSGARLARNILEHLSNPEHYISKTIRGFCDYTTRDHLVKVEDQVARFLTDFRASGRTSVDAFAESRPDFLALIKYAIVLELAPLEIDENLFRAKSVRDWYTYLLNRILPGKPDDLKQNLLRVITFNFDRSFERRLFLAVQATYGLSEWEAAKLCRMAIPVLHVHGNLGEPSWLGYQSPSTREYVPQIHGDTVMQLVRNIRIVHEEVHGQTLDFARQWLREAEVICFIGFGYHPIKPRSAPN